VTGFRFVDDHQAEYRVTDLCRVAGVSRSSFYAWRNRPLSARARANAELLVEIREIYQASRGTYGAPRVKGQLRRRGHRVSRHRVARLMATDGLVGVHGRKRWRRGRHPKMVPAPDLLQRDFSAERSDLRWVADISEFRGEDGKLYLAAIWDLHDHSVVGWSMGERQTTDLVVAALVMALGRRQPSARLLHHADHGSQYTSMEFTNRLVDWGIAGSYGSVGDCFDNAAMEAFWATLKKEVRHIWGPIETFTRSELRTILFDYIEVFYNRSRHQRSLHDSTPAEAYARSRAA
jgi:transposase InsO family protein